MLCNSKMATIIKRTIGGRDYYYYTRSYRVKDSPKANGKARGSGKSRVRTEQIYLGTAEDVIRRIQSQQSPEKVRTTSFGIEAVALKVIQELGLVEIIDRHVAKRHQGLSVGHYIATAIINRLVKPTSRAGIADWLKTSSLPTLFPIDPKLLKNQNFWDAFDKMLPEAETRGSKSYGFSGDVLDDQVIQDIEHSLWEQFLTLYDVPNGTKLSSQAQLTRGFGVVAAGNSHLVCLCSFE